MNTRKHKFREIYIRNIKGNNFNWQQRYRRKMLQSNWRDQQMREKYYGDAAQHEAGEVRSWKARAPRTEHGQLGSGN